jgi:hypothetical protein
LEPGCQLQMHGLFLHANRTHNCCTCMEHDAVGMQHLQRVQQDSGFGCAVDTPTPQTPQSDKYVSALTESWDLLHQWLQNDFQCRHKHNVLDFGCKAGEVTARGQGGGRRRKRLGEHGKGGRHEQRYPCVSRAGCPTAAVWLLQAAQPREL